MSMGGPIDNVLQSEFLDEQSPDVELGEFFDTGFMAEYTQFSSFDEFCTEGPWRIEDWEDLKEVPAAELDRYVRRTTQFDRWVAMQNQAAEREIRSRLLI